MPITFERQVKGKKLVWIDLGKGRGIRMYEDEARARGLLPPEQSRRPTSRSKRRTPAEDK